MIVISHDGSVRRVRYSGDIADVKAGINCKLFDVVRVMIGEVAFDIYVDDEGLSAQVDECGVPKWNVKATRLRTLGWLSHKGGVDWKAACATPPLAGNAVCLSCDEEGNTVELEDDANRLILDVLGESKGMRYEDEEDGTAAGAAVAAH